MPLGGTSIRIERIDEAEWPAVLPDFFTKGASFPLTAQEAERLHAESIRFIPFTDEFGTVGEKLITNDQPTMQYWAMILVIFPVLTVFGNILVVMSVLRESNLHTATNYFIVSLAGADIGLAIFVMPLSFWVEANFGRWWYGAILCDFFVMMDVMLCTASILNLAAISFDRYIAVTRPVIYSRHSNNFRVGVTIAAAWIFSLIIALPIACGLNNLEERQPDVCVSGHPIYIITSSIGSFYIPCAIMTILYYRVFRAIRKRRKPEKPPSGNDLRCLQGRRTSSQGSPSVYPILNNNAKDQDATASSPFADGSSCLEQARIASSPECDENSSVLGEEGKTGRNGTDVKVSERAQIFLKNAGYAVSSSKSSHVAGPPLNSDSPLIFENADSTSTPKEFKNMEDFRKHLKARIRRAKRRSLSVYPVQMSGMTSQQVYALPITSSDNRGRFIMRFMRTSFRSWRTSSARITSAHSLDIRSQSAEDNTKSCSQMNLNRRRKKKQIFRSLTLLSSREKVNARKERKATKTLAIVLGGSQIGFVLQ
ncbi:unnamed protein product [Calicophoron daubneyi]|uniref:G-protein coupled receptors family 1 profile domain-containing protein n=1 Tax=Calicophoron daubneyi TaxID=300641 RepID=A0AAV2TKR2_CALDB